MHSASLLLVATLAASSSAFVPSPRSTTALTTPASALWYRRQDIPEEARQWDVSDGAPESAPSSPFANFNFPNPLAELSDMLSSLDDVVDDFYNKRMGNGEVFYGKRKYKPSGRVLNDYNGGGLSDWRQMEAARLFREERAMQRALRGEFDED